MSVGVFNLYMSVHHVHALPWEARSGHNITWPGVEVTEDCE